MEAQGTPFLDTVLAGVAFLDAAVGGSVEIRKDQPQTTEYHLCGTRLGNGQDDFIRFATASVMAVFTRGRGLLRC